MKTSVDFDVDTVKEEKAQAIRLYKRKRNLGVLLRFAAFLAVMFSASSWLSTSSFSGAGHLLRESELYLNRPVFKFTLLNLIIAVLFFSHRIAAVSVYESADSAEESKQTVPVDNAARDDSSKAVTDTVNTVSDSDRSVIRDDVAVSDSVTASEMNESKKRYGLSKSEYIRRELRGSDDEMTEAEPRRKSVDDLSSEEFRLKIEKFIAAKKKTLIQENRAEIRGFW